LTFFVLVLANLGLIQANRSWTPGWRAAGAPSGATSSRPFAWIAGGTVLMLALVLGVPAVSRLFSFAMPPPGLLLAALGVAALAMGWFELVKWALGRQPKPAR
jgi:Ca2+-transporting ATPase